MPEICIKNVHKVPINKNALVKLIKYYYKGEKRVEVNFDNRIDSFGRNYLSQINKTYMITLSPKLCCRDGVNTGTEALLSEYDTTCNIILVMLHEIRHLIQRYKKMYRSIDDCFHPKIENQYMRYRLSKSESDAEGWALSNFNHALELYEQWCNE